MKPMPAVGETARIAAIRELLDRGYGRPREAMEVSAPVGDPLDPLRVLMERPMPSAGSGPISRIGRNPLKPDH